MRQNEKLNMFQNSLTRMMIKEMHTMMANYENKVGLMIANAFTMSQNTVDNTSALTDDMITQPILVTPTGTKTNSTFSPTPGQRVVLSGVGNKRVIYWKTHWRAMGIGVKM